MTTTEIQTKPATDVAIGGHWLNRQRLVVYPRMVLILLIATGIAWVLLSKNMVDLKGKPLGYDFITFWSASHLALTGHAADAYNIALIYKAEQIAVPASNAVFVWYYPPSFFLLIEPLARLHYLTAYWVFMLLTFSGYLFVFRKITRNSIAMWCLAAFAGLWMNFFHGQNAFLTAAICASALLCLQRRPTLAGVWIGLLVIKPHLALLFPVVLIAIGAWRTLAIAAVTASALLSAGTAFFGTATLRACLASLGYARIFLENGFLPWGKMPTVFAMLRLLHTPASIAYGVHAAVALYATFAVWKIWRRSQDWQLRSAALMTATFLISPYVFDYDLAWLAFPIAWIALTGLRTCWLKGEREILCGAWVLPLLMAPIADATHLQLGPIVIATLLCTIVRRSEIIRHRQTESVETSLQLQFSGSAKYDLITQL